MAKISPARTNFNAGEYSVLVEGRTDMEKYPASMRAMLNFIAAPQGPALRRSGTYHVARAASQTWYSHLIPFVFSDTQALQLEFSNHVLRFIFEEGVQSYDAVPVTEVLSVDPFQFRSATLDASVGSQVALSGMDDVYGINGEVMHVTAKYGNVYQTDFVYEGGVGAVPLAASVSKVYVLETPYLSADVRNIRAIQVVDIVYLFCNGYRPRVLSRYGAYDWRLEVVEYKNGPYMPSAKSSGKLTVTQGAWVSAGTAYSSAPGNASGTPDVAARAFDGDAMGSYWSSAADQTGLLGYHFATPTVVRGYTIYVAAVSAANFTATDRAPGNWILQGSMDGTTFTTLDTQTDYILYSNHRSVHIEIDNEIAYNYYQLAILQCTRNGVVQPFVGELMFTVGQRIVTVNLGGSYAKLNGGAGFLPTDVDRAIRVKAQDQYWRNMVVSRYISATSVEARLLDEPFLVSVNSITEWQFGYFSDTTGWPKMGAFFDDRLWVGGATGYPNTLAGSRVGAFTDMTQRTPLDEVLDDSAIVVTLNSKKLADLRWMESDERGLILGTGSNEWIVGPSSQDSPITARNIKARRATSRGSAFVEPVSVDSQLLFVQGTGRTVREFAYQFQSDGYQSPSMSLFSSHLGVKRFVQMQYASEPYSIVWFRREDGSVVGFTYNREEGVIGWHRHDFGGVVESISVIPSVTDIQDTLWLVVVRNGIRAIERMTRFWDFNSDLSHAHFVDGGLRYVGEPTEIVYGLRHMEGAYVSGVADGVHFENVLVEGYKITLPNGPASNVVVGQGFESFGEISRIEGGAADGTAQGKVKRMHNLTAFLWDSAYGEVGIYNEDQDVYEFTDVEYKDPFDEMQPPSLKTEMVGPIIMPSGYGKRGSAAFRQTKPLPFNVISLLPQLNTQDR